MRAAMLCPADLHHCDLAQCRGGCELCGEAPLVECPDCGVVVITVAYGVCHECFEKHRAPRPSDMHPGA